MNPSTPETPTHVSAGRCSGRLAPRHRLALIVGLVAVCTFMSLSAARRDSEAPTELERIARTNSATPPRDSLPFFEQSWVSPSGHTPSAHCSTIATLPSGDLLALWYGGTREGAADVALYTSRLPKGGTVWSSPVEDIDREAAEQELTRSRRVGVEFGQGRQIPPAAISNGCETAFVLQVFQLMGAGISAPVFFSAQPIGVEMKPILIRMCKIFFSIFAH